MPVIPSDQIEEKPNAPTPQSVSTGASGQDWFSQFPEVKPTSKSTQKVSTKTPPKPQATAAAPQTISATKPSFLDRVTAPFTGEGTVYGTVKAQREGQKWAAGQDPFSKPLIDVNAVKAEDVTTNPAVRGAIRGAEQTATDFTTPRSVELMAATGGLLKAPVVGKLVAAGFGLDQIKNAIERAPEFKKNLASGDYEGATKVLTEMALGVEMGRRALNHAGSTSETASKPKDTRAPTRPYSADFSKSRRVTEPEPAPVENPAPKNNPPNPRKLAPKASVPVEGPSDAEQRVDFERAQANLADLKKNGPRRKTPPWENRPLANRVKTINQQQEAAAKTKTTPISETPAAVAPVVEQPIAQADGTGQSQLPLGKAQPIESLPASKAAVAAPPKPVGSLGLQDAVENPVPVEAKKPVAEPVDNSAPQKARDGKVIWKKGDAVPDYDEVVNIDPHDLKSNPARFQYKQEAIGKGGTTDEFRDVKEWDPGLGGAMAVWQDPSTNEVHPINGHHRTEMAQRTNAPHVNVRFIDAKTPTEARTFGAMLNIGEGKGTALDAAKLFRDGNITPDGLVKYKISPTSKLAVQGMALSKLEPTIYRQVVDGKMTPSRGALIGDLLGNDHAAQQAAVDFFKQSDRRGTRYNDAEAADIIRSIKSAPEATEEIESLFGVDEVRRNLFGERAQVSAAIGKRLGREKGLFNLVSKKSNAEQLTGAGNILNAEDNQKISQEAAQVMAVYDRLKFSSGPVSDALNDAAKQVAEGVDLDVAINNAYNRIKDGVSAILGGGKSKSAAATGKGSGTGKSE